MTSFNSHDKKEKQYLLDILWQLFLDKVDAEWEEKYLPHGASRNEADATTKLAKAIQSDIVETLQDRPSTASPTLNHLTLHKYLSSNGWSIQVKASTIAQFLHYLQFKDWQEFKNQYQGDSEFTTLPEPPKNKPLQWQWIGPMLAGVINCFT